MNQLALFQNDNARGQAGKVGKQNSEHSNRTAPASTGQCGQVQHLIRQYQPVISLRLTADYAIPEAAARVHDLCAAGWNVITTVHPTVIFGGVEHPNVVNYSLGTPEWRRPEFRLQANVPMQAEMDLCFDREAA